MFLIKKPKQKLKISPEMDKIILIKPMKSGLQEEVSIY